MSASFCCAAEIEPGHVNASKYMQVTEQHMTQLGIPVFSSAQASVSSTNWTAKASATAKPAVPMQPAQQQPTGLKTGKQHRLIQNCL